MKTTEIKLEMNTFLANTQYSNDNKGILMKIQGSFGDIPIYGMHLKDYLGNSFTEHRSAAKIKKIRNNDDTVRRE